MSMQFRPIGATIIAVPYEGGIPVPKELALWEATHVGPGAWNPMSGLTGPMYVEVGSIFFTHKMAGNTIDWGEGERALLQNSEVVGIVEVT